MVDRGDGVDGVLGEGLDGLDGMDGDRLARAAVVSAGEEAAARLGDTAGRLDELVVRVAGLRAPSWRGRAAQAFDDALGPAHRDLRGAGDALERARTAARGLGAP